MARFRWNGERIPISVDGVHIQRPCLSIRYHNSDGSVTQVNAPDQTNGFQIGEDLGVEINDARALRHLRNDPRFEEIV